MAFLVSLYYGLSRGSELCLRGPALSRFELLQRRAPGSR
jgi:hypothetical protein